MIAFLTSSPCSPGCGELSEMNGLLAQLRQDLPRRPLRCVYLAASPDDYEINDLYSGLEKERWEAAEFIFESFTLLDDRCEESVDALLAHCDLAFLAGGHVPTQNAFYRALGLREKLASYNGVLFSISAGTMNAAETVYALPERPGEATDPGYRKFYTGLGLTNVMVIPHYQELSLTVLDGKRTIEDIACPDSVGHCFYALPDGSYFYMTPDMLELRGEAYRIQDGCMEQISRYGERRIFKKG